MSNTRPDLLDEPYHCLPFRGEGDTIRFEEDLPIEIYDTVFAFAASTPGAVTITASSTDFVTALRRNCSPIGNPRPMPRLAPMWTMFPERVS